MEPSPLPTDIYVANLGDSTFNEACDVLSKIIKEGDAGNHEKKRLREQVNELKRKHEETVREYAYFKKRYGRAIVLEHKRQFVNVKTDAPRTNAWNVGDYKALREPKKKKKKKNNRKKN